MIEAFPQLTYWNTASWARIDNLCAPKVPNFVERNSLGGMCLMDSWVLGQLNPTGVFLIYVDYFSA